MSTLADPPAVPSRQRQLRKTLRWYDGFAIGLGQPPVMLITLAFSVLALGGWWAVAVWTVSAVIGTVQAYIYAEPAAMFPDKSGGIGVYAREGWRRYSSLAGPLALFGYWFGWSIGLAVIGGFVGQLLLREFAPAAAADQWDVAFLPQPVTWPTAIGVCCMLLCYLIGTRGMRPALWFSYLVGGLMLLPVGVLAFGAFVTGDVANHPVDENLLAAAPTTYGDSPSFLHQFAVVMVWFYIIGWITYCPESAATFAPEFRDTTQDTRRALVSVGVMNTVLAALLPLAVLGTIGKDGIAADPAGLPYLVDVLHIIVGDTIGTALTLCLCAGLLMAMNMATMDSSRALYGLAREGMTISWLDRLNRHHVPGRAMLVDVVMNIALLLWFSNIFFIMAAGNLGYIFCHILALSGVLLLRHNRPSHPRPFCLSRPWLIAAGVLTGLNLLFMGFALTFLNYTGYLWDTKFTDSWARLPSMLVVSIGALLVGVAGYLVAQRHRGSAFRWREGSDECAGEAI